MFENKMLTERIAQYMYNGKVMEQLEMYVSRMD